MKSPEKKPKSEHIHYTKKRAEAIHLQDHNKRKYNRSAESFTNKKKIHPVLIVDNLPQSFGNIEKNNRKKTPNFSKEEEYLLNLIARIAVEIFIKEEL